MRRLLKLFNRFFMVPVFRLGLGRLVGNPVTGYYMVVRTVGRKTGRTRYAPVTYAIADGCIYCVAGYGRSADWYRNAIAAPEVHLLLPGREVAGRPEEVADAGERLAATRRIFRNAGLMGFTEGFDPFRAGDDTVRAMTAEMPVVRVRPADAVEAGAFDPGGRGWLWVPGLLVALAAFLVAFGWRGPEVGADDHAGREGDAVDEGECPARRVVEGPLAALTEHDGVDHEAILVDEVVAGEICARERPGR